jgi:Histidine kinase
MTNAPLPEPSGWSHLKASSARVFHAYAGWLVSIGWRRFALLALLLLITASLLEELPPFNWSLSERVETVAPRKASVAKKSQHPVTIKIDATGVSVTPLPTTPAASAASGAAAADSASSPEVAAVQIVLPAGTDRAAVKEAVEEARQAIEEAIAESRESHTSETPAAPRTRIVRTRLGDYLMQLVMLFILASLIIKITYKGRLQAEVKAARATEAAEAESLKRQVLEARVAAMQAQVEPHFLFNTLASIDHLIQTDPARASVMQKNLIALLRASMPTLREANPSGLRELGAELAVITPYLDILKVRMEERLHTVIDVPEGLRSAEFPPMVIQSLVENAIKHGLEPKPEGGQLTVRAQIVHGQLAVSVADTGNGFGQAATAGTGIGLANIRERLQLLYGDKAALTVAANTPSGTVVTVTVPYAARRAAAAATNRGSTL